MGKGNDAPEDLSKYTRMSSGESAVDVGNSTSGYNLAKIYANLTSEQKGISYHKSLDFSNVGMPTSLKNETTSLRQFHQTRLYIMDYGGVLRHTETLQKNLFDTYLISSNLPEQFSYTIGSEWSAPFKDFAPEYMNAFFQMGGGKLVDSVTGGMFGAEQNVPSTSARISTLQVWNGTKPLSLTLKIPVIDDGHPNSSSSTVGLRTNLVEALEFLGSLCLPKNVDSEFGFYQPPPSPYEFSYTWKGKDTSYKGNHARIMLQLGGILLVDNIIVKSVTVDYPNTKTMIRHWYQNKTNPGVNVGASTYLTPLLAMVTINITTSEALTANTYSNMLWLKQQVDQGSFNVNVDKAVDTSKNLFGSIGNAISNGVNSAINMLSGKSGDSTSIT